MLEQRVSHAFQTVHEEQGYVDPSMAAHALAGGDTPLRNTIEWRILNHPTREHLYPGTPEVLENFLALGDHVTIWTDDYSRRVATSGLGRLRRGLPREERDQRFSLNHAEDKINLLPDIFDNARTDGIKNVVIVDNSEDNLEEAKRKIVQSGEGINFHLAWINPEDPEMASPASFMPEITQLSVPSIHSLTQLREEHADPFLWIIDFNETLMDTPAYMDGVTNAVANTLRNR